MSKLLKLKSWLTLEDAARRIGIVCGETVTEADVLQLGLDGHLTLSAHLVNGACVRPCVPVQLENVEFKGMQPLVEDQPPVRIPTQGRVYQHDNGTYYQVTRSITELTWGEVCDLPMMGGERFWVMDLLQRLKAGPEVEAITLDGTFILTSSGQLCEVQDRYAATNGKAWNSPDNFHPAGSLPHDAELVVRTKALTAFEHLLRADGESRAEAEIDNPLQARERRGLLIALAAACKYGGLDYKKPAQAAKKLLVEADKMAAQIGETTLEGYLKKIPAAIDDRMRT